MMMGALWRELRARETDRLTGTQKFPNDAHLLVKLDELGILRIVIHRKTGLPMGCQEDNCGGDLAKVGGTG